VAVEFVDHFLRALVVLIRDISEPFTQSFFFAFLVLHQEGADLVLTVQRKQELQITSPDALAQIADAKGGLISSVLIPSKALAAGARRSIFTLRIFLKT
jgi:hypothetical protein